jgi:hypothetical protein
MAMKDQQETSSPNHLPDVACCLAMYEFRTCNQSCESWSLDFHLKLSLRESLTTKIQIHLLDCKQRSLSPKAMSTTMFCPLCWQKHQG